MSKPQKLKNAKKKGMSPEARATLGNAFKGIISNQCCVDGGKEGPWWVAAIFLCLSIILPLIPIMVVQSKTTGSQVLSGFNYSVDRGLHNTFKDAHDNSYKANIEGSLMTFSNAPETTPVATDCINKGQTYETYNFNLYFTNKSGAELQEFVNLLTKLSYEVGTKTPYDPEKAEQYAELGTKFYTPSFLVLTKTTMALAVYKQDSTALATSSYGGLTWANTPDGDLITYVLKDNKEATFKQFLVVLDQTFLEQKAINFRNNVLIYFGVYAGLILFLGLMVFILTRGKNNMFHFLSFFKCQKITWWAAFTPAVLGMIFAFIFSTNMIGQMSFVIFLALRIMWMSMRQLRPVQ